MHVSPLYIYTIIHVTICIVEFSNLLTDLFAHAPND